VSSVRIVGVLNITPDSFHDGGKYVEPSLAVERAGEMLRDGADILEVGGESTGPRSLDVSLDQELTRIGPVLRALREAFPKAALSVDTYKSGVASEALKHGVTLINDVTAGRSDPELLNVVAQSSASLVLMYAKDETPRTTIAEKEYDDVLRTMMSFLRERTEVALAAGLTRERLLVDPGLGHFVSSTPRYSFEILARLPELLTLGYPVFLSPSRKSFLAGREQLKTVDRLPGTVAASAIAVLHGATYIRTHDVKEVSRGCEIAEEVRHFRPPLR